MNADETRAAIKRFLDANAGTYFTKNQIAAGTKIGSRAKYHIDYLAEHGKIGAGERIKAGICNNWSDTFGVPLECDKTEPVDINAIFKQTFTRAASC